MAAPVSFEPWELELLAECRAGRLATIDADGLPNLVPVCYAFEGGHFAIAVDEKPKRRGELARVRNLQRDPRCVLLIDRYDDDWERLAWVRVSCTATVLAAGALAPALLRALRRRYPQYGAMALEGLPLLVLEPRRVRSWRWRGSGGAPEGSFA